MESETLSEALADGSAEVALEYQGDAVAEVKIKTLRNTFFDVTADALVDALAEWAESVEPKTQSKNWPM